MKEPRLPNTAAWKDAFQSAYAPMESLAKCGTVGQTSLDANLRSAQESAENAPGNRRTLDGVEDAGATPNEPHLLSLEAKVSVGSAFGRLAQTIIAQKT